ncbi:MAG: class I SAM-dependent methyltransferase [Gammaproteobacteria bacterium]|nr:class I SAM-dependent methyltransferase [Gammaproteobacteria bacterium]
MSSDNDLREKVLQSNRYVHSFLVGIDEYQKSPHFRPENQQKVRSIICKLTQQLKTKQRMIDFGCGTGFVINLAHDLYEEVIGVDITKEMMNKVDLSPGNIELVESLAEDTPFPDNHFDLATAYSFMDHLFDYKTFLLEVFRVLKPGGVFYSDLNPNREFMVAMENAASQTPQQTFSTQIHREIKGALHNGEFYQSQFGMDAAELEQAEPGKTLDKGFLAAEVMQTAKDIGFSSCKVEFEWFVNQGEWIHQKSDGQYQLIEEYLSSMRPLSDQLYKYLRFVMTK